MDNNDYDGIIDSAAQKANIPARLLKSIWMQETSGRVDGTSTAGALGPFQLMPATARQLKVNPLDFEQAANGAAQYLRQGIDATGSAEGAAAFYHGGPDRAQWGPKTAAYVQGVSQKFQQPVTSVTLPNYGQPDLLNKTRTPVSSGEMSDDDLIGALTGKGSSSAAPSKSASSDDDALIQALTKGAGVGAASASTQAPAPGYQPPPPSTGLGQIGAGVKQLAGQVYDAMPRPVQDIGSGIAQGVRDVGSTIENAAQAVDQRVPYMAATDKALGYDVPAMQASSDQARAAFEAAHGNSLMSYAGAGRLGGQALGTAPLAAGVGAVGAAALPEIAGAGVLPMVGRALVRGVTGAGQGAAIAAGTSGGTPDVPVGEQVAAGAEGGAALGAAAPAIGAVAGLPGRVMGALLPGGSDRIATKVLQDAARGGPTDVNLNPLVAGSKPTLGQATGNAGIATLERNIATTPGAPQNAFQKIDAANNAARMEALKQLKGTPDDIQSLTAARDAQADASRGQAFQNKQDVWPTNALSEMQDILKSPSIKRTAVENSLKDVYKKIVTTAPDGSTTFEKDPEMLYGVRQHINDMISGQGQTSEGRVAQKQLLTIRSGLDKDIEAGAPGYSQYMQDYAQMSKPIDALKALQTLDPTSSASGGQNMTLSGITGAIKKIETQQGRPGPQAAKAITDDQMNALYGLKDDLMRAQGQNAGMPKNSSTVQNLAQQHILGGLGGTGTAINAAVGLIPGFGNTAFWARQLLENKNNSIVESLANKLTNPEASAPLLQGSSSGVPGQSGLISTQARNLLLQHSAIPTMTVRPDRP